MTDYTRRERFTLVIVGPDGSPEHNIVPDELRPEGTYVALGRYGMPAFIGTQEAFEAEFEPAE